MTLKASSNSIHPAGRFFRYSVKRTMGLTVLLAVFLLVMVPGYQLIRINTMLESEFYIDKVFHLNDITPGFIIVMTICSVLAAMLYLYINFSFLYSRSAGDFFHALPITRAGLLFTRFAASIAPVALLTVLSYTSFSLLLMLDRVVGSMRLILVGLCYNLLILLALCAFVLLFIICAGSVADFLISVFAINVGMLAVGFIQYDLCRNYLFGFPQENLSAFLSFCSPFYDAFYRLTIAVNASFALNIALVGFTVRLVLTAALSLICSFVLYNHRMSEKSGVSYAYRFMYAIGAVIVGYIGAYFLGMVFGEGDTNPMFWVFSFAGAVLAAVSFGAINDRGFKRVKKSVLIGVSTAAVMGLFALTLHTGGLGYSTRVPAAKDIETVELRYDDMDISFRDPSLVLDLHRDMIETAGADGNMRYNMLDIQYQLKNGTTVTRTYETIGDRCTEDLLRILKSDAYAEALREAFHSFTAQYLELIVYYPEDVEQAGYLPHDYETVSGLSIYLKADELDRLLDAYIADLSGATTEIITGYDMLNLSLSVNDGKFSYYYHTLSIPNSFTNTLQMLDTLDLASRAEK